MQKNEDKCTQCGGKVDELGRTLPPKQPDGFFSPGLTVDSVVIRPRKDEKFHDMLLITRGKDPYKGCYAFPGGFVDYNENPLKACVRELEEECELKGKITDLVTVRGEPGRDPRKHVVSIVYAVEVEEGAEPKAGDDAATAAFFPIKELIKFEDNKFAFDHKSIIEEFLKKKYPEYYQ